MGATPRASACRAPGRPPLASNRRLGRGPETRHRCLLESIPTLALLRTPVTGRLRAAPLLVPRGTGPIRATHRIGSGGCALDALQHACCLHSTWGTRGITTRRFWKVWLIPRRPSWGDSRAPSWAARSSPAWFGPTGTPCRTPTGSALLAHDVQLDGQTCTRFSKNGAGGHAKF